MDEYVPYEERARRADAAQQQATAAEAETRRKMVEEVSALLARLAGHGVDTYLEILKPLPTIDKFLHRRRTIIHMRGVRGGPDFIISEVLRAYRVPSAIVVPPPRDSTIATVYDAHVVPDGRVWRFIGAGDTSNTYQSLASSVEKVDTLAVETLARIAEHLRNCT